MNLSTRLSALQKNSSTGDTEIRQYMGRPLCRRDNLIYYGDISEKYIIQLQIMDRRKVHGLNTVSRVKVRLMLTDPGMHDRDRILRQTEIPSLDAALKTASAWLDRARSDDKTSDIHVWGSMKRIRRPALAAAVMALIIMAAGAQSAFADQAATVTATALYLRSQPSTASSALACAKNGDNVLITDSQDGWYQVVYNGQSGYMCADYLSVGGTSAAAATASPTPTAAPTATPKTTTDTTVSGTTGTVNSSYVRFRSTPSTSGTILGVFSKGDTVTITGTSGDWYAVNRNGTNGYVLGTYLSVSSTDTAAATATPVPTATTNTNTDTTASGTTGTVNSSFVRFRATPSTSGTILGVFSKGDTVTVTETSNGWCAVSYNGTSGYVFAQYVSTGSAAGSTAADTTTGTTTSTTTATPGTTGTISQSYVRFRAAASTASAVLGTFSQGDTVTITGTEGEWYSVIFNGTAGYVYAAYVSTGTAAAENSSSSAGSDSGTAGTVIVTSQSVVTAWVVSAMDLRAGPDVSYSTLAVLPANTRVTITGYTDKWYQVSYNGRTGYIYKTYLTTTEPSSAAASASTDTAKANAIAETARSYVGVQYVYGGTSLDGFDASGLVYYVYRQNGYTTTRTSTAQNGDGLAVARSDLQPGDIIIFYNSDRSGIGSSGIYIGNNQFVYASSSSGRVIVASLNDNYYNTRFYAARRIINR